MGGELSGEAGELDVLPGGTCSRSVTVVTSRLVTSGGGSGTSACCPRSSGSGTCGGPTGCSQGSGQGMQSRGAGHGFLQTHWHQRGHWHAMGSPDPPSQHLGVA